MKNKIKNKKGFTLMEMLIVVAIMVVLVAVAVPTFTSQVRRSNIAADKANERAAKAVAAAEYLASGKTGDFYFDAAKGTIYATGTGVSTPAPYSKSLATAAYIEVNISTAGVVTVKWSGNQTVPES